MLVMTSLPRLSCQWPGKNQCISKHWALDCSILQNKTSLHSLRKTTSSGDHFLPIQCVTHTHRLWSSQYRGHDYCVFRPMHLAYSEPGCLMYDSAISFQVPSSTIERWYRLFWQREALVRAVHCPLPLLPWQKITFRFMEIWQLSRHIEVSHDSLRREIFLNKNVWLYVLVHTITCQMSCGTQNVIDKALFYSLRLKR